MRTAHVSTYRRRRTGLVVEKLGMTMSYEEGMRVPLTALRVHPTVVVAHKTKQKNGYNAVEIATGERKLSRMHKSIKGHLAKAKISSSRVIKEFRVSSDAFIDVGSVINSNHFVPGQYIDVRGKSIGKGFAGVMKRHNFRGLEATHGVSVSHRSHGSTGQCQDPGRVMKGKKMAGHMGDVNVCMQNLQIFSVDNDNNILYVKGSVPGHKGAFLFVQDSIKKALLKEAPFPAYVGANNDKLDHKSSVDTEEVVEQVEENIVADKVDEQEQVQKTIENADVKEDSAVSVEENSEISKEE